MIFIFTLLSGKLSLDGMFRRNTTVEYIKETLKYHKNKINKLGLSCAKLRIVELKIEDNKILRLNENWSEKHE